MQFFVCIMAGYDNFLIIYTSLLQFKIYNLPKFGPIQFLNRYVGLSCVVLCVLCHRMQFFPEGVLSSASLPVFNRFWLFMAVLDQFHTF